jgi:hypothetical protein
MKDEETRGRGDPETRRYHRVSASPCPRVPLHPSSFIPHPCFWRSELELNQPLGFFRPALIHLSYPTVGARGETRTHDTGFAIRRLSRLATRARFLEVRRLVGAWILG